MEFYWVSMLEWFSRLRLERRGNMWPSLTQTLALMLATLAFTIKPLNAHKDAGMHAYAYTPASMTHEVCQQLHKLYCRPSVCASLSSRTLALLYLARNVIWCICLL